MNNNERIYQSIGALLGPLVLLSNLCLLLGGEVVDYAELLTDLFSWFTWVRWDLPFIMVATLAQQSSIRDFMSR